MPAKSDPLLHLQCFAAASLAVFVFFLWEGHTGFNLWDEGYLWYGVQRVMQGAVPIRDFMAYDPGRYYWSAGLMGLWGDNGIVAMRATVAMFEALGIFAGVYCMARTWRRPNPLYLMLSVAVLLAWMYPRHKLVDISVSIFLVGALAWLVENPTVRRYFLTGVSIGLAAVFGRNHGIYGAMGGIGVILYLSIRHKEGLPPAKGLLYWTAGIAAGFSPILLMALLLPGFAGAFWDSIAFLFEIKATAIPLPVPWPWRADFSAPLHLIAWNVAIGALFIAIIAFGVAATLWVCWQRYQEYSVSPVLVASAFLTLPYLHRAFSRASINTLAQSIYPVLIGCLVILAARRPGMKWAATILLCAFSIWFVHPYYEGWQCRGGAPCADIEVSGDKLRVVPYIADDVALLRQLADEYAPDGRSVYVVPFWPGAYPLLERISPTWEIYALFPHSTAFERAEIERLKTADPGYAFIYDLALDGRDELRFRNTHPLIFQYILDHFQPVASPNPDYLIFKAKTEGP